MSFTNPVVDDASATPFTRSRKCESHLADSATAANQLTGLRIGFEDNLQPSIRIVGQQLKNEPGKDGGLYEFHLQRKYTPLAYLSTPKAGLGQFSLFKCCSSAFSAAVATPSPSNQMYNEVTLVPARSCAGETHPDAPTIGGSDGCGKEKSDL